jgi:hypothetical protein
MSNLPSIDELARALAWLRPIQLPQHLNVHSPLQRCDPPRTGSSIGPRIVTEPEKLPDLVRAPVQWPGGSLADCG